MGGGGSKPRKGGATPVKDAGHRPPVANPLEHLTKHATAPQQQPLLPPPPKTAAAEAAATPTTMPGTPATASAPVPTEAAAAFELAVPAAAAPLTSAAPVIIVAPHHHTYYCDRKRTVCTADGAFREGNRLVVTGPAFGLELHSSEVAVTAGSGTTVQWFRSREPHPSYAALRTSLALHGHPLGDVIARSQSAAPPHYDGTLVVEEPGLLLLFGAKGCAFELLALKRRHSEVFPLPAAPGLSAIPIDADPAAAYGAATSAMGARASTENSPLFTAAAAVRLLRNEAAAAARDPFQHHLTVEDVGHYLLARVTVPGRGALLCRHVGPIEPAPPRIRDLWVEGEAVVGGALRARCLYYGGMPDLCLFSWVRVDSEGNRTESDPRPWRPHAPMHPEVGGTGEDDDPRVLRVTPADLGCAFKVSCEPVRFDGVRGAPTTSKPTAEVAAVGPAPDAGQHAEPVGSIV